MNGSRDKRRKRQRNTDASAREYYTKPAEAILSESIICNRCGATMATYADKCSAPLNNPCPGFIAIEDAVAKHGVVSIRH